MLWALSVDHVNSCGLHTVVDYFYPCFDFLKAKSSLCTAIVVVPINVENVFAGA